MKMRQEECEAYMLLCSWRQLVAEKQDFMERADLSFAQRTRREEYLCRLLLRMEMWMRLLSLDERYVIKRHLVDGVTWACVTYEYNHKLLRTKKRSFSTLRRLQRNALKKIVEFEEGKEIEHSYGVQRNFDS